MLAKFCTTVHASCIASMLCKIVGSFAVKLYTVLSDICSYLRVLFYMSLYCAMLYSRVPWLQELAFAILFSTVLSLGFTKFTQKRQRSHKCTRNI